MTLTQRLRDPRPLNSGETRALMKRAAAEIERLRDLLRLVADEPNIDKGRALADAELHGPNVEVSR